jgi:SAM-dependent methyltransferase
MGVMGVEVGRTAMGREIHIACNLCGSTQLTPLYRPKRSPGPIVRCNVCGLVYVSPRECLDHVVSEARPLDVSPELRVSADVRALEDRWENVLIQAYLRERCQKTANAHALLAAIERFVPIGKILDFGAGPGLFLAAAKERGWQAYLRSDTFPEAHFDVVTALQVLEHLTDPLGTLCELHHVIRPGGMVAVEVPNISNAWVDLLGRRHRHFVEDHLFFFSPATLRCLLEKAGFVVVKQGYSVRRISVRACLEQLGRYVNSEGSCGKRVPVVDYLARRLPFATATLSLNLGDIIYAFAVKQVGT